jgi:hypothetical protein
MRTFGALVSAAFGLKLKGLSNDKPLLELVPGGTLLAWFFIDTKCTNGCDCTSAIIDIEKDLDIIIISSNLRNGHIASVKFNVALVAISFNDVAFFIAS